MIEDGGVGGGSSPEIRPKADILTLKLREEAIVDEKLLDSDMLLGLDEDGELVALEVWDASKRGLLMSLTDLITKKGIWSRPFSKESPEPLFQQERPLDHGFCALG